MSTRRKPTPSYLPHKQSGRARAVWTDSAGTRHQKLLPGHFDSSESRAAFGTLQLELEAAPHSIQTTDRKSISLAELLLAYDDHAQQHYRTPDGRPTSEIHEVRIVVRALRTLYGDTIVSEFGPLCVKAARQKWVNEKRSRTECNRRVALVKRIFKWAVAEELVPPAVHQAIAAVTGLQKGRTTAHETEPVGPVDDAVVDATVACLQNRHVRGLVEFQRLTGCRPGEACMIRRCDIDIAGPIWLYKPPHHKNSHRGKNRIIAVGPKAQELLRDFFTPAITDYLFSPERAFEEWLADRSANRKTPRSPTHLAENAAKMGRKLKRSLADHYDRGSYGLAIDRSCDKAFPPPGDLARREKESRAKWWARLTPEQRAEVKAWQREHRWHPNQLRHSYATKVRKQHGLEAAQVLLGHSRADVTQIYAERNEELAATVAAKIG
ncbi:MAG: tyrosine-type recombinase/integrase [Planctomycetes bacterium]|nr:tyrosine-type recombinase/integrase [Planctomycetota bacterium]